MIGLVDVFFIVRSIPLTFLFVIIDFLNIDPILIFGELSRFLNSCKQVLRAFIVVIKNGLDCFVKPLLAEVSVDIPVFVVNLVDEVCKQLVSDINRVIAEEAAVELLIPFFAIDLKFLHGEFFSVNSRKIDKSFFVVAEKSGYSAKEAFPHFFYNRHQFFSNVFLRINFVTS